jgi:hypothetical protein
MSHPTKLSEVEQLRHQIDVWSTQVEASRNDMRMETVLARRGLERCLDEARARLASLRAP